MPRYPMDEVTDFVQTVLVRLGVRVEHAQTTALRMVEADVNGMSGHGVMRLPAYVRRLESGGYNLEPDIRVVRESSAMALLDGDNGLGQVVVSMATELAIAKASAAGVAWVGVRRSNHAGAGGVYASMAVRHGMIGVYIAIGNAAHMAPWGGVDPLMSTNPLAVAIPAGAEPPVVFDMATTVASYGRIKVAARRGETIPEGWVMDRNGAPVTDPTQTGDALLLPIGGYKGYGLNLVIASLAGVLNGAASGSDIIDFNADFTSPTNTGHAVLVLRPDLLRPLDEFASEMDHRLRELRDSTPRPGDSIRIPGDGIPERRAQAVADGVPIDASVVDDLRALAGRLGLTPRVFRPESDQTA